MGLDNATVKEFANLINPFDKTSGEATVYGRVVGFNEIGGRPIVNLDGSTQNIPIRTTVKVKGPKGSPGDQDYYAGDRVLVRIKNHEALIISNISTQMTTAEGAEDAAKQYVSDNGFIYAEKISGEQGDFYTLSADKFTATEITGALGHFITVNADRIITDAINAQIANIDTIKASDVVAGEGDFSYLNVDRMLYARSADMQEAKINKAFVGDLLAKVGLLSSATIVEGHVTGYLDSVEVNANKITAGTLLVDRLYIKDQNNKWKMQTVDGQGHTVYVEAADRINERTITADKLVAHSITTDELNATNITANNSSFMESLTNSLTTNYLFATQANVQDLVAHSVDAELAELDILNINEELKTQNIHLGEIVFDQPSKPSIASDYTDYILGIERETKTISAYDSTALYSEGDYVTNYYSKDNLLDYPYYDTTKTNSGITYTDNGDGSVTCNGTATANIQFFFDNVLSTDIINYPLQGGKRYIISTNEVGIANAYMWVRAYYTPNKIANESILVPLNNANSKEIDLTNYPTIYGFRSGIIINNGTTVNNLTFKPKIRLATNEDATWYPFVKGVYKCIKPISTAELWDENKWYYLRDAINGDQYEFDHVRYSNIIPSYVGMIIHSTTLDTLAKVQAVYGSNTIWISLSGYVLRGATSGVTPNNNAKDLGNDTHTITEDEMPNHDHVIPALSGSTGYISHDHAHFTSFGRSNSGGGRSDWGLVGAGAHGGNVLLHTASGTPTVAFYTSGVTQNHYHSVSTNESRTGYKGSGTAMSLIPNEKNVYIWERVDEHYEVYEDLGHV